MSQQEVIDVLRKSEKPLSRTEIAKELNLNVIGVSHSLMRLVKGRDIKVIEIDRRQALKNYHCKRRMRLYYV
jgi:predicted ArsR family transcriptional regulator